MLSRRIKIIWIRFKHFIFEWRLLNLFPSLLIFHLDNLNIMVVEIIVDFHFSFILDFPKFTF